MISRCQQRLVFNLSSASSSKMQYPQDYAVNWSHYDAANLLRMDSIRSIHVTKSGHPSSCASLAELFSVLFFHNSGLKFHAQDTRHFLNDRLVLSKGHAAPILYSALYRAKVIDECHLMSLRVRDSIFQGHPTPKVPFVDVATGSLGQGLSVAAGMAYSSKYFDKIDNRVYCVTGDGEMAEGNIWEAMDFAQNYKLDNLTLLVDMNRLGQSQPTMYKHNPDLFLKRFESFGWSAQAVDGHSIEQISNALQNARKQKAKPYAIVCKTIKGKNLGQKVENRDDWHGKDLGSQFDASIRSLRSIIRNPNMQFRTYPPLTTQNKKVKQAQVSIKPCYDRGTLISTRKAYGNALRKARECNENVVGLDGDTRKSTFAATLQQKYPDSFIECFIAEQNMVGVAMGLSCRNKIAFCSSFAAFLMRAADQVRVAGIGGNPIKIVGSHSGCSIGQDGPSQMALQDLGLFRNIPNGIVLVPSDGVSIQKAVEIAANYREGPSYIRTSRPDVPILYDNSEVFEAGRCKVLRSSQQDRAVLISHGVTVHQCLRAHQVLSREEIQVRVVDLFSLKPIDRTQIAKCISECQGNVLVVEDHYEAGGAYEAVCGVAAPQIKKIRHLCVTKTPGSAKPYQQMQIQKIDALSIEGAVRLLLS